MTKKDWIGILYVSLAIILWGTIGSLIDYPLLITKVYEVGSLGQLATFSISGLLTSIVAILIFKRFIK